MKNTLTYQELLNRINHLEKQLQEAKRVTKTGQKKPLTPLPPHAPSSTQELANQLQFIKTLFDTIPNPVFYKNRAGVYLGCNQSFANLILGIPAERIIGCTLYDLPDLIPRELADIYLEKDLALFNNPGLQVYETKAKCADGQFRDYIFYKATYPDHNGAVAGIIGLMVDITDQNRIKSELKESEEKYRSMMQSMNDAVYICSPDFRISYMNPKMIERIGYDASGQKCHKVLHNLEEPCEWCTFPKVKLGAQTEVEVLSPKDGLSFMVTNSPIFHADGSISKMTIYRDITLKKQMEKELLVAKKLEATGVFASGIAHDYNNLLFTILGNILMSKRMIEETSEARNLLQSAEDATRKATKLTKRLLAFTHGESLVVKDHSVRELIHDALGSLGTNTLYPVKLQFADDLRTVRVDAGLITIVLQSILENAQEAMKDGGPITITATNVVVDGQSDLSSLIVLDQPSNYICIAVSDCGSGIAKDILPQIFDPYFSTKQRGAKKGLGFGLSTSYSIIQKHTGAIRVDSEKGAGTTVSIFLPAEQPSTTVIREPVVIKLQ